MIHYNTLTITCQTYLPMLSRSRKQLTMCSRVVIICALGLFAASPSHADDPCTSWDDNIDDLIFEPAREQIRQAGKEREPIPDVDQSIGWHTGISTTNGTLGDLTSFKLAHFRGGEPASFVCQTSNDTHSNVTLAFDVGLSDLSVTFDNFLLQIPILPNIGNTLTTVSNSGNAVSVSVSVLTTPTSDCIVKLNYFQIHDPGTFSVQFKQGFWNWIYQRLFNVSTRLMKWILGKVGVMSKLENQVSKNVYDLASQHGPQVCEFIHNIIG